MKDPKIAEAFQSKVRAKLEVLSDSSCASISSASKTTSDELCPELEVGHRPWIENDPECQELTHKRREAKKKHFQGQEYRRLYKEVNKACRRAKRRWLRELCMEAERATKRGDSRKVYQLIKKVAKKKIMNTGLGLKSKEGVIICDMEGIKARWFRYGKRLFDSDTVRATVPPPDNKEPDVLLSEIRAAIRKSANNKAPGMDGVASEMLKAGGETVVAGLKAEIDRIWHTGVWHKDWSTSEIIALPKVAGAQDCEKHRTISLISHVSKVLIEVIRSRMAYYVHPEIAEEQFGFMPGKGTADAILALRNIIEKTLKRQDKTLWILFVDYTKAFDSIEHPKIWNALEEL